MEIIKFDFVVLDRCQGSDPPSRCSWEVIHDMTYWWYLYSVLGRKNTICRTWEVRSQCPAEYGTTVNTGGRGNDSSVSDTHFTTTEVRDNVTNDDFVLKIPLLNMLQNITYKWKVCVNIKVCYLNTISEIHHYWLQNEYMMNKKPQTIDRQKDRNSDIDRN